MKRLNLPLSEKDIESLVCGEQVYLSGTIYTARDAAHSRMISLLNNNESLPFDINDQTIYYVGPTPSKEDGSFGSAGPTTSSRMDKYTPTLLDLGLKCMIGKGYRNEEVKQAIVKHKAVYFVAAGGAGAILGKCVKKHKVIAFDDLLSEAIQELYIEDFPVFVGIDSKGNDIYDRD